MEELFSSLVPLIFIIVAIVAAMKRNGQAKNSNAQTAHHQSTAQPLQPLQPSYPSQPARPLPHTQTQPAPAPKAPMQPRVQTTVSVSRHDHSGMFDGSMGGFSMEGEDPDHDHGQRPVSMPSQYSDRILNAELDEEMPEAVGEPALDLKWSDGPGLVRAFVMQEVLTRPCDRRR